MGNTYTLKSKNYDNYLPTLTELLEGWHQVDIYSSEVSR